MKYLLSILLVASPFTDLDKIAKVNKLKKEAKKAYNSGDYKTAIDNYTYLLDSMDVEDDNITLNLANAYYKVNDSTGAVNNYKSLINTKDNVIKSVAHQQLGVIANRGKKFEEALAHFKNAIRSNPQNDEARYNYEMLKKMLDEQKKDQKDKNKDQQNKDQNKKDEQQKKDQQNKDQQSKDQQQNDKEGEQKEDKQQQDKNKEGEKKDEQQQDAKDKKDGEEKEKQDPQQPQESEENKDKKGKQEQMQSFSDKLEEMKISEEKARMILEALKNNEKQYFQQNKRKPTKRKDPNKPDW